ncbi:hypothetical protein GCM10027447_36270 [Glycomyces halotolerans]
MVAIPVEYDLDNPVQQVKRGVGGDLDNPFHGGADTVQLDGQPDNLPRFRSNLSLADGFGIRRHRRNRLKPACTVGIPWRSWRAAIAAIDSCPLPRTTTRTSQI